MVAPEGIENPKLAIHLVGGGGARRGLRPVVAKGVAGVGPRRAGGRRRGDAACWWSRSAPSGERRGAPSRTRRTDRSSRAAVTTSVSPSPSRSTASMSWAPSALVGAAVDDVQRPAGGGRSVVLVPGELIGAKGRGHHVDVAVAVEVHRFDVVVAVDGVGRAVDDVPRPDGGRRPVVLVPGELIGGKAGGGHHVGVAVAVEVHRVDVEGAVGVGRRCR